MNDKGIHFRWSQKISHIDLVNYSNQEQKITFSFDLASTGEGSVEVLADKYVRWILKSRLQVSHYSLPFLVAPGSTVAIEFRGNVPQVDAPLDSRKMYFYLAKPSIE